MTFEEFLRGKKIDPRQFQAHEPDLWALWQDDFAQQHPASFTAQKLYLINPMRRKYHLKPQEGVTPPSEGDAKPAGRAVRPVFKPKTKM